MSWESTSKIRNWLGYKGNKASVVAIHKWMCARYGSPKKCSNDKCEGRSDVYEWCLKKGKKHKKDRNNYLRMCRSCHRKYDLTEDKRKKAIKNLSWNTDGKLVTKPVIRINGKSKKRYESVTSAAKDNNLLITSISNCLSGRAKSAGGYRWENAR